MFAVDDMEQLVDRKAVCVRLSTGHAVGSSE